MKTLIHAAALIMVCVANLQAQDSAQVLAPVAKGFEREFAGATHTKWEKAGPLYAAKFRYDDGFWVAYFDKDGALVASGRKVGDMSRLPLAVQRGFAREQQKQERRFGSFYIGSVYELVQQDGVTSYLVPIENSNIRMTISTDAAGNTSIRNRKMKTERTEPATEMLAATSDQ